MSRTNSLLMLVGGLAAGAALGILFAPASGKETRTKLMRKGEKLREDLADLVEQGKDMLSQAKGAAGDAVDSAKDIASNAARKATSDQQSRTQQASRSGASLS